MSERRMFTKNITNSASFIKMPPSTQMLYFHLCLNADDDGVVEAFTIMRLTGASEDDLKVLVAKNFVTVLNEDLVTFINDWREHNKLRADRKIDSKYKNLLLKIVSNVKLLKAKPRADRRTVTGTSHVQPNDVQCPSNGLLRIGKVRIGKNRIEKEKIKKEKFPFLENEEFKKTFNDYLEMRNRIRKPATERAQELILKKLHVQDLYTAIEMLERSITNSWQDVFQLPSQNGGNYAQPATNKNYQPTVRVGSMQAAEQYINQSNAEIIARVAKQNSIDAINPIDGFIDSKNK